MGDASGERLVGERGEGLGAALAAVTEIGDNRLELDVECVRGRTRGAPGGAGGSLLSSETLGRSLGGGSTDWRRFLVGFLDRKRRLKTEEELGIRVS